MPKQIISIVEATCRSFLWACTEVITRKSPMAWKKVCTTGKKISLLNWNKASMVKNMWNLNAKADGIWIKWIHTYYYKDMNIMQVPIKNSASWIIKKILCIRDEITHL